MKAHHPLGIFSVFLVVLISGFSGCGDPLSPGNEATFTVTYEANDADGGSVPIDGGEYAAGDLVAVLGNPNSLTRTGYTFSGWSLSQDGSARVYTEGETFSMSDGPATLYAQWTALQKLDTPTFSPVPGNYNSAQDVTISADASATVYYTLDGSTPDNSSTEYTGTVVNISETTTIKAIAVAANRRDSDVAEAAYTISIQTSDTYQITYDGNDNTGGTVPSATDPSSSGWWTVEQPGDLVKDGFVFQSWNTKDDGTGTSYEPQDVLTSLSTDLTLYAVWRNPQLVFAAINSDVTGDPPDLISAAQDESVTLPSVDSLSKDGYTAVGWTVRDGDGTEYLFGDSFTMPGEDTTMNPVWWQNSYWRGAAVSGDGSTMAIAAQGSDQDGSIYISTDGGSSWSAATVVGEREWRDIAISDDGTYMAAVVDGGSVWLSNDSGANWIESTPAGTRPWRAITGSDDGTTLAAVAYEDPNIYTSTDSGNTWTGNDVSDLLTTMQNSPNWKAIAASGTPSTNGIVIHAVARGQQIIRSADSGVSWDKASTWTPWNDVATSDDGKYWVAAHSNAPIAKGYLYRSTDFGQSWSKLDLESTWDEVTISNDGQTIVASVYNGVQYSSDGGQSFAYAEGIGEAEALSISDDGMTVLGVAYDGLVYISTDSGQTWAPVNVVAQ